MQDILGRWRALEGQEEERFALYRSSDHAGRSALLAEICARGQWVQLVWVVQQLGVLPGQVAALEGALALGGAAEPLWLLLWRDLAGLGQAPLLDVALAQALSARGVAALRADRDAYVREAPWQIDALLARVGSAGAAQAGPLDALWEVQPVWPLWAQELVAQPDRGLLDVGVAEVVISGLGEAADAGSGRARGLLVWLLGWLAHGEPSWQPVLEQLWQRVPPSTALAAGIWRRQVFLLERGVAARWLPLELSRRLADLPSRESLMLGLPRSLERVDRMLRGEVTRPVDYAWLVAAPEGLMRTLRELHRRTEALPLSGMLAAVPRRASRWAVPLWLELRSRQESVVSLELARLFERLVVTDAARWLEAQLRAGGDVRVMSAAVAALSVVGDERSVPYVRGVAWRCGLAEAEEQLALSAMQRRGVMIVSGQLAIASSQQAPPAAELTQREDVPWERLALAPRPVSSSVLVAYRGWHDVSRSRRWVQLALWYPPVLLAGLIFWWLVELPWPVARAIEDVLGAMVLLAWPLALCVLWMRFSPVPDRVRAMLERGDAMHGRIGLEKESMTVSFVDARGAARVIPLPADQREGVTPGARVQMFYDGKDVLLAPTFASSPGGELVPQHGLSARANILVGAAMLIWIFLALLSLYGTLMALVA
jgi:hypothetical protein